MKVIRQCCFETNSSSCHSVCIGNLSNARVSNPLDGYIDEYDEIFVIPDEYGWSGPDCRGFMDKLEYAICMLLETEYPDFWRIDREKIDQDTLESLSGYQILLHAINEHEHCKKIVVGRNEGSIFPYGYIDHQSREYESLQDFFDNYGVDAERFLFDEQVYVSIDNDNW